MYFWMTKKFYYFFSLSSRAQMFVCQSRGSTCVEKLAFTI